VIDAIEQGRVYSTVDALAGPAALSFSADGKILRVVVQAPPDATTVLLKDGRETASGDAGMLEYDAAKEPGVYRVEVRLPGAPGHPPVPWIITNAIYVGRPATTEAALDPPRPPKELRIQYGDGDAADWEVEQGLRSAGAIDRLAAIGGGMQVGFRFALGGTRSESPYAAMVMPAGPDIARFDRLIFTARASRPMRMSVQLRAPGGTAGQRWHRSVVLDPEPREITVFFDDMIPRGITTARRPVLADVQSVLFVIDTVNADTGSNGQVTIDDVKYAR
jgi:hypothetical protein